MHESRGALVLDADRACGVLPALRAMRWCIARARELQGMACATVRHSGHAVAAAPYVELAAEAGLIGFACTNAIPTMAPPGGTTRIFGTNPIAYGVPAGRHPPVILDMSSSTVAGAKIIMAAQEGRPVLDGLVADAEGNPTTDPAAFWPFPNPPAGLILPLGFPHAPHKGFGLAMLVDVLAGVLAGGAFGRSANLAQADLGQFFWALDVEAFMPRGEFLVRMDEQIDQIKGGARRPDVAELLVPGERGSRRRSRLTAEGAVPLSDLVWRTLEQTLASLDVPLPPLVGDI